MFIFMYFREKLDCNLVFCGALTILKRMGEGKVGTLV
jgi:hypothetical protein